MITIIPCIELCPLQLHLLCFQLATDFNYYVQNVNVNVLLFPVYTHSRCVELLCPFVFHRTNRVYPSCILIISYYLAPTILDFNGVTFQCRSSNEFATFTNEKYLHTLSLHMFFFYLKIYNWMNSKKYVEQIKLFYKG